jgi:hypothetical protein
LRLLLMDEVTVFLCRHILLFLLDHCWLVQVIFSRLVVKVNKFNTLRSNSFVKGILNDLASHFNRSLWVHAVFFSLWLLLLSRF